MDRDNRFGCGWLPPQDVNLLLHNLEIIFGRHHKGIDQLTLPRILFTGAHRAIILQKAVEEGKMVKIDLLDNQRT